MISGWESMKTKFLVVVEKGLTNFFAFSPDLPGCIATGKTVEETLETMHSAIDFHLEGMVENGEELPVPKSLYTYVRETDEISADDILTSVEIDLPQLAHA